MRISPYVKNPIQRKFLDIVEFWASSKIDERLINPNNTTLDLRAAMEARGLIVELKAYTAVLYHPDLSVKYPENWWQAFKEQYFPKWALQKWPVKYTIKTFRAVEFHPEIYLEKGKRPEILLQKMEW